MLRIPVFGAEDDEPPPLETVSEREARSQQKDLSEAIEDLNRSANTSIFSITLATTAHSYVVARQVDPNAVRVTGVAGVLILVYALVRFLFKDLVRQANPKYRYKRGYVSWKGALGAIPVAVIFLALVVGEVWLLHQMWGG